MRRAPARNGTARADGAAYDPISDTWTSIAAPPIGARYNPIFASDVSKPFVLGG